MAWVLTRFLSRRIEPKPNNQSYEERCPNQHRNSCCIHGYSSFRKGGLQRFISAALSGPESGCGIAAHVLLTPKNYGRNARPEGAQLLKHDYCGMRSGMGLSQPKGIRELKCSYATTGKRNWSVCPQLWLRKKTPNPLSTPALQHRKRLPNGKLLIDSYICQHHLALPSESECF